MTFIRNYLSWQPESSKTKVKLIISYSSNVTGFNRILNTSYRYSAAIGGLQLNLCCQATSKLP